MTHPTLSQVTESISKRSLTRRRRYLDQMDAAAAEPPVRSAMACSNLAHGIAACVSGDKERLSGNEGGEVPNLAIVTAYNDMLSAHQPYESYPALIRDAARAHGAVAQVAGGVPAMCDGVTQGMAGMDLSLFSRDVIALSTAVALSHNMFDGALCLGICDKIVPGLLMGALSFGHLPVIFVPAGPMRSGLPNKEKASVREEFAAGKVGRTDLLAAESASYHSPGTCTFYGTANSNQMLMEFMGLQLPGGSFINPDDPLREQLTLAAVDRLLQITRNGEHFTPLYKVVCEKSIVNAMVGLLATGGSTNHTIHLVAVAAAAGIEIDWSDFDALSRVVPLLAEVYPNGLADINHFRDAGGLGFVIRELLEAGLLHDDVLTIAGPGLHRFTQVPEAGEQGLTWKPGDRTSADYTVVRKFERPFQPDGGLRVVSGNIGRGIVKTSAVPREHRRIKAPARVFTSQEAFEAAYERGELNQDFVAVLPGQGPASKGMPELHKLTPFLGNLQNQGYKVALVTDGRMSGASGKILAAIHITPEAAAGGLIARIRDGDMITIDAANGTIDIKADLAARQPVDFAQTTTGTGREMFEFFRLGVTGADKGATVFHGR